MRRAGGAERGMAAVQPAAVPAWVAGSLPPDFFAAQEVDARGAVVRQRGSGPAPSSARRAV